MAKVSLRSYNREIETMIDRGQLDEAVAQCHHILKTFPKHLETYRLLGKAYLEGKRYGDAVDIFQRILASVPNDFVAQVGMSIIRDEENKLDDAIWHMERAFETQPSNSAIQGELQRLYGRRDGVQPPRIRMTRGALAHMYVQGELYPQAISEIKSVLKEDSGRSDMQALLARACYKSGAKNDAVDAALALLQRYPFSLDANRVLVEVLSADRNENAQVYRQRLVELDPYAAQVNGSVFQSNEVSDAAVSLERLDWNGQPVGMQSDWRESQAIGLESGMPANQEPDWLKNSFTETAPNQAHDQTQRELSQPTSGSMFQDSTQPAAQIPDFLKEAGWEESTSTFDESKSMFGDEPAAPAGQTIEEGDLPDWVKAMKPQAPASNEEKEEELPDWINQIGPSGALSSQPSDQPDWMQQLDQPSTTSTPVSSDMDWMNQFAHSEPAASQPTDDQPDWSKGLDAGSDFTPQAAQTDVPDWMKGLGDETPSTPAAQSDVPEWMSGLASETPAASSEQSDTHDWMSSSANEAPAIPAIPTDLPDWARGLGDEPATAPSEQVDTPDWMSSLSSASSELPSELPNEAPAIPAVPTDMPDWARGLGDEPTTTPSDQANDTPDWMSGLASETPATPAVPSDIPDWVRGLGDETPTASSEQTESADWMSGFGSEASTASTTPSASTDIPDWMSALGNETPATPSSADVPDWISASGEETPSASTAMEVPDWMKGIAETAETAEPDWLNQVDDQRNVEETLSAPVDFDFLNDLTQEPMPQTPSAETSANMDTLGVSEQERDDSFSWLESLAAKQGASEGLLTKPEDRLQEEPEWVKQAKNIQGVSSEPPVSQPLVTPPAANVEDLGKDLGKSDQERDDSFSWLESLAAKQGASEGLLTKPEDRLQEEPEWVKLAKDNANAIQPSVTSPVANVEDLGKSDQERDDSFAWLENLAAKQGASEGLLTKPEERLQEEPEWVKQAKESALQPPVSEPPVAERVANVEDLGKDLGKSDQERDDSFAWLENLAAKQGASEGLLTKPEERLQEEPEWVRQAKDSASQQPPVSEPSTVAPSATIEELGKNLGEDLGKSEQEQDDSFAWLENLAAKQGASEGLLTKPEERLQEEPEWVKQAKDLAKDLNAQQQPVPVSEQPDDTEAWLKDLAEKESAPDVAAKMLDVDMPAWMNNIERDETPAAETSTPASEAGDQSDWISALESPAPIEEEEPRQDELPNWLSELETEENRIASAGNQDDLPEWLRGDDVAPSQTPEPTRTTDWKPAEIKQPEPELIYTPAPAEEKQSEPEIIYSPPLMEEKPPEPEVVSPPPAPVSELLQVVEQHEAAQPEPQAEPEEKKPASRATTPVAPPRYVEPVTRRGTGMLVMPGVDPMLGMARNELSRSNIPGGLESYGKLIKKGRFLDEVIHDLREAIYRYPVDVSIWQSLGDAYMRANRLQDALDAYTKAEELLR